MTAPMRMAVMVVIVVGLFALLVVNVTANVIGIDFGSDTMKVAVVQPGTPFEIGNLTT